MARTFRLFLLFFLVTLAVGCDSRPRRVPVAGSVTIDGQPLTSGFVRFVPTNGRPATGAIDANGRYQLTTFDDHDGAILGQHRVEVIAVANPTASIVRYLTPTKYQDSATSGLAFDISKPETNLEIKLTWNGERPQEETRINEGDVPILPSGTP